MRNRFDKQLVELNNELIQMGSLIEKAIELAFSALIRQDVKRAKDAIRFDEEINHQEKVVESLCLKLLLEQQPVAGDLRLISAALKMITDMERIGDHAADISEITILLGEAPYLNHIQEIKEMAKETTMMVVNSIEAFVTKDVVRAEQVIKQDDKVDLLFDRVKKGIIELIAKDATNGEQAADLLMVAKYFERIGDHATNIAEWVLFSITGVHKA